MILQTCDNTLISLHYRAINPHAILGGGGGGVALSLLSILSFFTFFCEGQCFGDKMDNTRDKRDKRDKNFGQMRQKIRQAQM